MRSELFAKYFDHPSQDSLDISFFVIEEVSIFNPSLVQTPKKRTFTQVRKLADSEVLILLLLYLKTEQQLQSVEVKLNGDILKRIGLLNELQNQQER
jgi:hypothetical protein